MYAMEVAPSGVSPEGHHIKSDPLSCTQSTMGVGFVKVERSVSYFNWPFRIMVMPHSSLSPLTVGFQGSPPIHVSQSELLLAITSQSEFFRDL